MIHKKWLKMIFDAYFLKPKIGRVYYTTFFGLRSFKN